MPAKHFAMKLVHNDVSGQRGEPYILIPKQARDADPAFWSWIGAVPFQRPINVDENGATRATRLYWFPKRSEFRFCSDLYATANAQAGWYVEIVRNPAPNVDYLVRFHSPASAAANSIDAKCIVKVRASKKGKTFGYW